MTEDQNALLVFIEELGEVAVELLVLQKSISKAIRFGMDERGDLPESNRQRISSEWNDLLGAVEVLAKRGIDLSPDISSIAAKVEKIEMYAERSKDLGHIRS